MQRTILHISLVLIAAATGLVSCKKTTNYGAPSISRIRLISQSDTGSVTIPVTTDSTGKVTDSTYTAITIVGFDSTATSGQVGVEYAVLGSNLATLKTITVNGVSATFLPGLVTNTSAIFTVPPGTPFGSTGNGNFQLTTDGGTASFTWPIQQPPPIIATISPTTGVAGDTMTITGSIFQGVTEVSFDSTHATIIAADSNEIQVLIPAGVTSAYIYVFTPGGVGKSPTPFGFKSIIYVNGLQNGWGSYTGYNSVLNFNNTTNLQTGDESNISVTFQNLYGALQIGYGGVTLTPSALGLTALKFSVYGGAGIASTGQQCQIVMNGVYNGADEFEFVVMPGVWQTFTVPLSVEGNPSPITEFVLQGVGAPVPSTIYVADIGFI